MPTVFEAVRNEFGPELPLLHDSHHRLTPLQNQEGLRLVRSKTTTPLAIGEVFNTIHDFRTLVNEQLIDYVRAAVTHFGGVSPIKKLFDFAAQHQIKSAIHGPEDISPVGMAAAIHLDLAIHNFGIQEYAGYTALTSEVFRHKFTFADGYLHPGEAIGLGVELDEELAAAHPYAPGYLPVNRLADGTVHDW